MRFIGALPAVGTVVCLLVLAGCGDEADSTAAAGLDTEPARMVKRMLADAAVAKNKQDCAFVARVNLRSTTKIICPSATAQARRSLRTVELTDAAVHGTGAVVAFRSKAAPNGAAAVLSRDKQGQWALKQFGIVTTGSEDTGSRKAVDAYLEAVRKQDCDAYFKSAYTQAAETRVACRQELPLTRELADALKANPTARARYLGGSRGLGFYGLETTKPQPAYYTISTATTPEGSLRPSIVLAFQRGPLQ